MTTNARRIRRIRIALALAAALPGWLVMAKPSAAADLSGLLRRLQDQHGAVNAAPADASPAMSREEATRVWDAFLTSVVKSAGQDAAPGALRDDLLAFLLDERYVIVSALATATTDGPAWLSAQLSSSWERLDPLIDRVATQVPPEAAHKYQQFLQSGRIMSAFRGRGWMRSGPPTPASLRDLARVIQPADAADPLTYDTAVDPQMREIFGFGPPLPAAQESPLLAPFALRVGPLAVLARLADRAGDWLVPAASAASATGWDWHTLVTRLNAWVPSDKRELRTYLPMVREMLDGTAHTLADNRLPEEHFTVYRNLVVATAWQESCWRQYERKAGQVEPVRGPGPSLGLMQVNTRVWRGLYDTRGLGADIGYNGRAGAEILYHYLRMHALRGKEHMAPGGEDNLARATYSAYNGGPGHLRRYRSAETSPGLRAVDTEFWQKYQAVERGDESAFFSCAVKD